MKTLLRASFVVLVLFLLRSCSGCGDCEEDVVVYYDCDTMKIKNLDNSQEYAIETTVNTMYRSAVAFSVQFGSKKDSLFLFSFAKQCNNFGFASVYAFQPAECYGVLTPKQTIENLKITTMLDIDDAIKAQTDVTQHFVLMNNGNMYSDLSNLAGTVLNLALTKTVQNDSAQFIFTVLLSDNRTLSDTTNMIMIHD